GGRARHRKTLARAPARQEVRLLHLDAGLRDHVFPQGDLFPDLLAEALRVAAGGRNAIGFQLFRRLADLEDLVDLGVDALDRGLRQVLRTDEAVPEENVEPFHAGFGNRRHVWFSRQALRARHRDGAQAPGLYVRRRGRGAAEEDVGL